MIKLTTKIITIASLTLGLGFYSIPKNSFSLSSPEIKSTKVQNNTVPVALPYRSTVTLKTDKTMSGKIKEFDQQKSTITLETSRRRKHTLPITDITEVKFRGEYTSMHSEEPVIRGDDDDVDRRLEIGDWRLEIE